MYKIIFIILIGILSSQAKATIITAYQHTDAVGGSTSPNVCQDEYGQYYCYSTDYVERDGDCYLVCVGTGATHCPIEEFQGSNASIMNDINNSDICSFALCQIINNNLNGSHSSNIIVGVNTYYRTIVWSATSIENAHFDLTVTKVIPD